MFRKCAFAGYELTVVGGQYVYVNFCVSAQMITSQSIVDNFKQATTITSSTTQQHSHRYQFQYVCMYIYIYVCVLYIPMEYMSKLWVLKQYIYVHKHIHICIWKLRATLVHDCAGWVNPLGCTKRTKDIKMQAIDFSTAYPAEWR